ncbi:MAG: glycosyltransferase 2 family protein [Thermomicrobiales bacterium]|nr:glycosyltransferase 2 family protein [Thermomicrobiales bacterium]
MSGVRTTEGAGEEVVGDVERFSPNGLVVDSVPDRTTAAHLQPGDEAGPPASLGSRLFRPHTVVSFGVAIAIIFFFVRRLDVDPHEVWRNIRRANVDLYAIACALFYLSFLARAVRWRWMLKQAGLSEAEGYKVPGNRGLIEIFLLSWFVNCVVPAKLGDAYRCYLLKRRSGVPISRSLGTILAERLTDLVVLFAMMAVAGVVAFRGHLPSQATRTLLIGSVLLAVGAVGVVGLWYGRHVVEGRLPERFRLQFSQLHDAIFACLRRPLRPIGVSLLIWGADGLRLYLVAASLHGDVSLSVAYFVSLMSALLTTLPITPAGLGVVEVAMIGVLKLVDVQASLAGSIALMDRLLTYWSLVAVGLILYLRRLRSDVR